MDGCGRHARAALGAALTPKSAVTTRQRGDFVVLTSPSGHPSARSISSRSGVRRVRSTRSPRSSSRRDSPQYARRGDATRTRMARAARGVGGARALGGRHVQVPRRGVAREDGGARADAVRVKKPLNEEPGRDAHEPPPGAAFAASILRPRARRALSRWLFTLGSIFLGGAVIASIPERTRRSRRSSPGRGALRSRAGRRLGRVGGIAHRDRPAPHEPGAERARVREPAGKSGRPHAPASARR